MNNDKFVKWLKKYGDIRPVEEAFKNYPVEEEEHKGRIDAYVEETEEKYNASYKIGDIVYVRKFKYENGKVGTNHLFVIIGKDNIAIPIENYFGMLISSKTEKTKYQGNKLLVKDNKNNLKVNSIVKSDVVYKISKNEISYKVGKVSKLKIEEYKKSYMRINKDKAGKVLKEVSQDERERYIIDQKAIADVGYDKGIAKGLQEGKKREKKEIAKKMKEEKISIGQIIRITGLSKEEIENL